MPAIELTRLKAQIETLLENFDQPDDFHRALSSLCEQYSNRTYRPGQAVPMMPLTPMYHVPPLLIRQLGLAFEQPCEQQPEQALILADELWNDSYLEPRMIAVSLLGRVPISHSPHVSARLSAWCKPQEDRTLIRHLLSEGSLRLRREAPSAWFDLARTWTQHNETAYQAIGVRALLPVAEESPVENLPPVFSQLAPLLKDSAARLQNELLEILHALARRTPRETAYFLRQVLSLSNDPALTRLTRRCLPALGDAQGSLRAVLAERGR